MYVYLSLAIVPYLNTHCDMGIFLGLKWIILHFKIFMFNNKKIRFYCANIQFDKNLFSSLSRNRKLK